MDDLYDGIPTTADLPGEWWPPLDHIPDRALTAVRGAVGVVADPHLHDGRPAVSQAPVAGGTLTDADL